MKCFEKYRSLAAQDLLGQTDIDDSFDLSKHSGDGLTNEWYSIEEPGFADQDIEKRLVDANKLDDWLGIVRYLCVLDLPRGTPQRSRRSQLLLALAACPASERQL